jgi:hypothetical protein
VIGLWRVEDPLGGFLYRFLFSFINRTISSKSGLTTFEKPTGQRGTVIISVDAIVNFMDKHRLSKFVYLIIDNRINKN